MRVAIATILAATLLPVASSAASYTIEPAWFIFGAPGELIIDASDNHVLIETPDEIRQFKDQQEFVDFMKSKLNAEESYDPKTGLSGYRLHVQVLGTPMHWDAERQEYLTTPDAAAYFLGGRFGYAKVGSELRCINLEICGRDDLQYLFEKVMENATFPDWVAEAQALEGYTSGTENSPPKHTIMFRSVLVSPDYDVALGMMQGKCEACGPYGCVLIPCTGYRGGTWNLEVQPFGYYFKKGLGPFSPPAVASRNARVAQVKYEQITKSDYDLECFKVDGKFWLDSPVVGKGLVDDFTSIYYFHRDSDPSKCGNDR